MRQRRSLQKRSPVRRLPLCPESREPGAAALADALAEALASAACSSARCSARRSAASSSAAAALAEAAAEALASSRPACLSSARSAAFSRQRHCGSASLCGLLCGLASARCSARCSAARSAAARSAAACSAAACSIAARSAASSASRSAASLAACLSAARSAASSACLGPPPCFLPGGLLRGRQPGGAFGCGLFCGGLLRRLPGGLTLGGTLFGEALGPPAAAASAAAARSAAACSPAGRAAARGPARPAKPLSPVWAPAPARRPARAWERVCSWSRPGLRDSLTFRSRLGLGFWGRLDHRRRSGLGQLGLTVLRGLDRRPEIGVQGGQVLLGLLLGLLGALFLLDGLSTAPTLCSRSASSSLFWAASSSLASRTASNSALSWPRSLTQRSSRVANSEKLSTPTRTSIKATFRSCTPATPAPRGPPGASARRSLAASRSSVAWLSAR